MKELRELEEDGLILRESIPIFLIKLNTLTEF
jgi:hypothetical protein